MKAKSSSRGVAAKASQSDASRVLSCRHGSATARKILRACSGSDAVAPCSTPETWPDRGHANVEGFSGKGLARAIPVARHDLWLTSV